MPRGRRRSPTAKTAPGPPAMPPSRSDLPGSARQGEATEAGGGTDWPPPQPSASSDIGGDGGFLWRRRIQVPPPPPPAPPPAAPPPRLRGSAQAAAQAPPSVAPSRGTWLAPGAAPSLPQCHRGGCRGGGVRWAAAVAASAASAATAMTTAVAATAAARRSAALAEPTTQRNRSLPDVNRHAEAAAEANEARPQAGGRRHAGPPPPPTAAVAAVTVTGATATVSATAVAVGSTAAGRDRRGALGRAAPRVDAAASSRGAGGSRR